MELYNCTMFADVVLSGLNNVVFTFPVAKAAGFTTIPLRGTKSRHRRLPNLLMTGHTH